MAYLIDDTCISCGSCEGACPAEAIYMDEEKGHYMVDVDKCIDCGTCADACPVEAIKPN